MYCTPTPSHPPLSLHLSYCLSLSLLPYLYLPSYPSLSYLLTISLSLSSPLLSLPLSLPLQHLFASEHRDEIIKSAIEHAGNFIGITLRLRKDPLTFEDFVTDRLGKYGSDESITSLAEFVVQKISPRHSVRIAPIPIALSITFINVLFSVYLFMSMQFLFIRTLR